MMLLSVDYHDGEILHAESVYLRGQRVAQVGSGGTKDQSDRDVNTRRHPTRFRQQKRWIAAMNINDLDAAARSL